MLYKQDSWQHAWIYILHWPSAICSTAVVHTDTKLLVALLDSLRYLVLGASTVYSSTYTSSTGTQAPQRCIPGTYTKYKVPLRDVPEGVAQEPTEKAPQHLTEEGNSLLHTHNLHHNSDRKKMKEIANENETKRSACLLVYSACRGSNPRPQINPKLHTSYVLYRDQADCLFFWRKKHDALHTAHARAPKLGRQHTSNLSLDRQGRVLASRAVMCIGIISYLKKKHPRFQNQWKREKKKAKKNGVEPASSNL